MIGIVLRIMPGLWPGVHQRSWGITWVSTFLQFGKQCGAVDPSPRLAKSGDLSNLGVQAISGISDYSCAPSSSPVQLYVTKDCKGDFTSGKPDMKYGADDVAEEAPASGSGTCSPGGSGKDKMYSLTTTSTDTTNYNDKILSVLVCPAGCEGNDLLQPKQPACCYWA